MGRWSEVFLCAHTDFSWFDLLHIHPSICGVQSLKGQGAFLQLTITLG